MKLKFILLLSFFSCISSAQIMWQLNKDTVITWYYQEGDEFNGDKINTDYWSYSYGWARTIFQNKEQQYYTEGKNHIQSNGTLKLIAKKETVTARAIDQYKDDDTLKDNGKIYGLNKTTFNYSAGMIQTKNQFLRGYYECRFKLPKEKGYWPAFWLYGGSPNEEIDIFECKTEKQTQVHIDTHCPNHCDYVNYFFQKKSYGGWVKTKYNFTEEFNVLACDWDEDQIKYYLNGECIGIAKVKFAAQKPLVLNIAVPSNNGPFHPGPDKDITTESIFEIDYVRVWNKNPVSLQNKTTSTSEYVTQIEDKKPVIEKSMFKTKGKLTYGKKSDHKNEGVFVSFFNNKNNVQINTLGSLKETKLTYTITNSAGAGIQNGTIENMIFTIDKASLAKGECTLTLKYGQRSVSKAFTVD